MRLVTYGAAASLDGFIAGPHHEVDWLVWNDEVAAITADYWKTVDTVVMGRKTYEAAARAGMPSYPDVANFLCTRTMTARPDPRVEIASDGVELVRTLRSQAGKDICIMGGGDLARSLLRAGLIDRIGVNIQPVLLGGGIPLLPPLASRSSWDLLECRALRTGSVYLLYRHRAT